MTFWASWREERVGGMPSRKCFCQRDRERTQVGVLGLTTSISSSTATSSKTEKGEDTDSLLMKGAMEAVRDENRGFYSNLFLVKKQDGGSDVSSTQGAWTCIQRNEILWWQRWRTFSEHQERRLGGTVWRTFYSWKARWNQWGTRTEASTPICSWSRNRTGLQICHQLKGPELMYKETNCHDDNVEKRFSEHQERRLGGYNRPQGRLPSRAYCKGHRRFIGFWWQGRSFQLRRLQFSSAPRTITTISLPVVAMCKAKGIRLIAYLDDFLVLARNWRQLISHTSIVLDILDQAGFRQNLKKYHLQPRQKF